MSMREMSMSMREVSMSMREMSMIDPKGSAVAELDATYRPNGTYEPGGDWLFVDSVLRDAIADVRDGIEFWKTLGGNPRAKCRASREFLNRNG